MIPFERFLIRYQIKNNSGDQRKAEVFRKSRLPFTKDEDMHLRFLHYLIDKYPDIV